MSEASVTRGSHAAMHVTHIAAAFTKRYTTLMTHERVQSHLVMCGCARNAICIKNTLAETCVYAHETAIGLELVHRYCERD